jgi:transposase
MARRVITMTELIETIRHWHAGHKLRSICTSLGMSRNTVRKYVRQAIRLGLSQHSPLPDRESLVELLSKARTGNPHNAPARQLLEPMYDQIEGWFKDPNMTTKQVWRLLQEQYGLSVGYTTVKRYVRDHIERPCKAPTIRMETPPGQQAQVDFGYAGRLYDSQLHRMRKAWAFIMVLSHSRHRFVRFVFRQDSDTWIDCHRRAFEFFKGVPAIVVLDNLKTGVLSPDVYDPTINKAYMDCAEHYGFLVDPAKVRKAQHKGKVERQVIVVRQQVLAGRTFQDSDHANRRALAWCCEEIGMAIHGTTHLRPYEVFQEAELPAMKALPAEAFDIPTWKQCTVHQDHYIVFNKAYYSMPSRFIGKEVWVRGNSRTVQAYHEDRLVKTHQVAPYPGFRRTDTSDLPSHKVTYLMTESETFLQHAQDHGEFVSLLIAKLLDQPTMRNRSKVHGILRLGEHYGAVRLNNACARALVHDSISFKSIRRILEKGLDQQAIAPAAKTATLSPEGQSFLRPGEYYARESHAEGALS